MVFYVSSDSATATTVTSNGSATTATTQSGYYADYEFISTDVALKETVKKLHIHPWRQEPKRLRFDSGQAVKVSPAIFDRKPFLNAYKSARSMAA